MNKEFSNKKYYTIAGISLALMSLLVAVSFFLGPSTNNYLTGLVTSQVYVLNSPPRDCSIQLNQGLHLVSFYCVISFDPVNDTMVNYYNQSIDYYAMWHYNPTNPLDKWDISNPHLPNYTTQQIKYIDRRDGYWIYLNSSASFFNSGYKAATTTISLFDGWNLISYPSDMPRDIVLAFGSINGSYTTVETYQSNTSSWLNYTYPSGGTLTHLDPMAGYWINISSNDTWIVNW